MRDALTLGRRGFIAALGGTASACSPAALLNTTVSRKGYSIETDIAYGASPRQKLDFYKPDTPRPDGKAVVFFYGGGWRFGNKTDSLFVAQALAARGIAVVVPITDSIPMCAFLRSSKTAHWRCGGRLTGSAQTSSS